MRRPRRVHSVIGCVVGWIVSAGLGVGCGDEASQDPTPDPTGTIDPLAVSDAADGGSVPAADVEVPTSTVPVAGGRCLVRLHGKSGHGGPTVVSNGLAEVFPDGNADGWGGRQWLYFPDDRYREAVAIVDAAIADANCSAVAIDGFSNGAAFAAKLYCRGESFGGRLLGVVIDDPVPDHATAQCSPAAGVEAALYWTTGLDSQATAGTDCAPIDWTCEGGAMVGIDAYAASLGLTVQPSPHQDHQWYLDPPELAAWLSY